uniref:Putative secreted protein n=1 Tax=Ixodes scapularis TaxID=6945 RepID=A0A4D5RCF2_IXOSC
MEFTIKLLLVVAAHAMLQAVGASQWDPYQIRYNVSVPGRRFFPCLQCFNYPCEGKEFFYDYSCCRVCRITRFWELCARDKADPPVVCPEHYVCLEFSRECMRKYGE